MPFARFPRINRTYGLPSPARWIPKSAVSRKRGRSVQTRAPASFASQFAQRHISRLRPLTSSTALFDMPAMSCSTAARDTIACRAVLSFYLFNPVIIQTFCRSIRRKSNPPPQPASFLSAVFSSGVRSRPNWMVTQVEIKIPKI